MIAVAVIGLLKLADGYVMAIQLPQNFEIDQRTHILKFGSILSSLGDTLKIIVKNWYFLIWSSLL